METMVFDAEAKRHLIVGAGRGSAGVDVRGMIKQARRKGCHAKCRSRCVRTGHDSWS